MTTSLEQKQRILGRIGLLIGAAAMAAMIGSTLWYMATARQTSMLGAQIESAEMQVAAVTKQCAAESAAGERPAASGESTLAATSQPGACTTVASVSAERESLVARRADLTFRARAALVVLVVSGVTAVAAGYFALR